MKKLFCILIIFLLAGCTPTGKKLDEESTIILNIVSEVDPLIVSSHGEGNYNSETKTYTLNVPSTNPVDISLSHPGYVTVSMTITQTELLEGAITRSIDFGKAPTATLVFKLYTNVDLDTVTITDYEFTRENSIYTIKLPSRDINKTITISAENYQPIELEITPEKLVVGYYYEDFFLIGENQVLLKFISPLQYFSIILYDLDTFEEYKPYIFKKQLIYILDKGTNVFYNNPVIDKYTHLNMNENKTIDLDVIPGPEKNNYIISDIEFDTLQSIYFEHNGKREKMIYVASDNDDFYTNIPIGSQILFEDKGMLYYMDHIPSEKHIFWDIVDFGEAILPELKFSVYDLVSNSYINQFIDADTEYKAINKIFTSNEVRLSINGYYVTQDDLLVQEKNENNEWSSYIEAAPSPDKLLLEFTDSNGNIIENPSFTFHDIYFNGFFLQASGEIKIGSRILSFSFVEYVKKLEFEKIDGKFTYKSNTPIKIETDSYEFAVYSKTNDFYLTVDKREKEYYMNYDIRFYRFKVNETITIQTKYSNVEYVYTLTKEILEKGILIIDEVGSRLPDQTFEITFQNPENSSFLNIFIHDQNGPLSENAYRVFYNDGRTVVTVYYIILPEEIFVEYISNNVSYGETCPYDDSGKIVVLNP